MDRDAVQMCIRGDRVQHVRTRAGLGVAALAKLSGLPVATLEKAEEDRTMVGVGTIVRLASAYGVAPAVFAEWVAVRPEHCAVPRDVAPCDPAPR